MAFVGQINSIRFNNSNILFYNGVPVNNTLCFVLNVCVLLKNLDSLFFNLCASSTIKHSHDIFLNYIASFIVVSYDVINA